MNHKSSIIIVLGLSLAQSLMATSICSIVTTEEPDRQPLPRASITVTKLGQSAKAITVVTDRHGTACVSQLSEGLYSVEAGAGSFMYVRYYPVRVWYPRDVHLTFRLPLADVREGGLVSDSTLSGTLAYNDKPADGLKICLFRDSEPESTKCTVTNDLGQYALVVPPGVYRAEVTRLNKVVQITTVDVTHPGDYRKRILLSGTPLIER